MCHMVARSELRDAAGALHFALKKEAAPSFISRRNDVSVFKVSKEYVEKKNDPFFLVAPGLSNINTVVHLMIYSPQRPWPPIVMI